MARFVFVTWDGGGNTGPAVGLAQELRARGHDALFGGYPSQASRFTERGFRFVVLERSQESLEGAAAEGLLRMVEGVFVCAPQLAEVPELVARERADAVIIDCLLFAALTGIECTGVPAAVLVHSAPGAMLQTDRNLGAASLGPLNELRVSVGLEPVTQLWDTWNGMTAVCSSIPELDPLRERMPSHCRYVGPIVEQSPPSQWELPWPTTDDRPLILVSFSTYQRFPQRSRIERTLAGLAGRPYRVLVTTGQADVTGLPVPENAALVTHIPHRDVLPQVAATVTHGGHGTVIASLAHGVPLVTMPNPQVADQIPLSRHLERLGVGKALDGDAAPPQAIAAAVDEVLTNPEYRSSAEQLATIIRTTTGAATAADLVERVAERPHADA